MTDLEITKACAEAMEIETSVHPLQGTVMRHWFMNGSVERMYHPLYDDAQAFQLLSRFGLFTHREGGIWTVGRPWTEGPNLNRCICECVARMQLAKAKP